MKVLLFILFALTLASCSIDKSDTDKYINKFNSKKADFEKAFMLLSGDTQIMNQIGHTIRNEDLSKDIQIILNDLDITNVNTSFTQCIGIYQIEFVTHWTTKGNVHFIKGSCDKDQSKRGFHTKISDMIEVWGLGDHWIMLVDRDFI